MQLSEAGTKLNICIIHLKLFLLSVISYAAVSPFNSRWCQRFLESVIRFVTFLSSWAHPLLWVGF